MNNPYTITISIYNNFGELKNEKLGFDTLDEMGDKMEQKIFKIVEEARDYATENNMLSEETYDSKDEADFDKDIEDYEDLTPRSDLNNPANFL